MSIDIAKRHITTSIRLTGRPKLLHTWIQRTIALAHTAERINPDAGRTNL